jgi:hypothetical protein
MIEMPKFALNLTGICPVTENIRELEAWLKEVNELNPLGTPDQCTVRWVANEAEMVFYPERINGNIFFARPPLEKPTCEGKYTRVFGLGGTFSAVSRLVQPL